MQIPLVVLVPTHGRLALLERTLDSVLACTPPPGRPVRVIVIENGGRFGCEEIVRTKTSFISPEYAYVAEGNKSRALNAVIETIGSALIVFLDDDVRVDPALLVEYSVATGENTHGHIYGGGVLVDYEAPPPGWLIDFLPLSAKGWRPDSDCANSMPYFFGANWAAFTTDILKAGGFDPKVGPGGHSEGTGQETLMQRALIRFGAVRHYLRDAVVWHYVPRSRCSPRWALRRAYREGVTLGLKSKGPPSREIFGIPLWMLRICLGKGLLAVVGTFSREPTKRFQSWQELYRELGRAKGMRHIRQQ